MERICSVALLLLSSLFVSKYSHAQTEKDSINREYRNWYYDSREKLYQRLGDVSYDVVFLGNSITERGDWQELIGKKYAVANRGIGGDNTFGVLARLDGVIALQPKKLFLAIGINDIGRGLPNAVILENYRTIVRRLKEESPRTRIYLQSVLPLNDAILPYDYLKGKTQKIIDVNIGIQQIAEEFQLPYLNLHEVFGKEGVLAPEFTTDGIHLVPVAYRHWVAYLKKNRYL